MRRYLGMKIIATDEESTPSRETVLKFSCLPLARFDRQTKEFSFSIVFVDWVLAYRPSFHPCPMFQNTQRLQKGTIVMHHALVNAGAKVGANCIINTKALIEHDAVVEDHCHIATAAIVNGGCQHQIRGLFWQ